MNPNWHIFVLIPARNEESLLPRCLASVHRAVERVRNLASADVILAADQCTDRTAIIASSYLQKGLGSVVEVDAGAAGTARFMAAQFALRRLTRPLHRCWLANTDADCVVPPNWLTDQLQLAVGGVEGIAGTVDVDSFADFGPHVARRFRETYTIEADGTHPHVHGANLGVRGDAYVAAGGWPWIETGEDHDLWGRLRGLERRVVSTSRIQVLTSGRRCGRAPRGFADRLVEHDHAVP